MNSKGKEILKCDVLVTGGGSAGVAAAVSAARLGGDVILLEKNSFLGGKATAAYVGTICGLYYHSFNTVPTYVSDGFAKEFAEKIKSKSGIQPVHNKLGLHFLPYKPLDFKILCDEYVKHPNIRLFLHTSFNGVNTENNEIKEVEVLSYDSPILIQAKSVIDTTGEALSGLYTNSEIIESEEYQASAQVFSMNGIPISSEANLSMILMKEIQQAIHSGELEEVYSRTSIVPGSLIDKKVYLKIGLPVKITNKINKATDVEIIARTMVETLSDFLIKRVEPFKNAILSDIAPEAGIRTGKRNKGKYILTKEDVLSCKKFQNSSARGAWPIEFWDLGKRVKMDFFEPENYYDIPETCLQSNQIDNLFFAGRNISATEEAIASARVMGTCLQTGFHAGSLAVNSI